MNNFSKNKIEVRQDSFLITENMLFYILLFLNVLILFSNKYFVTLDGGSHNYNANIINQLLFNDKSYYHQFYELNKELLPNSFSYCLFIVFKKIFTFSCAEKALLLIHLVLTPILFRKIVQVFNHESSYLSYAIFPFTHFSLLYMGFFNFTIGIVFCLLSILIFLKFENKPNLRLAALFFLVLGLSYFSHIFTFTLSLIFFFTNSMVEFIVLLVLKKESIYKWLVSRIINLILPASIFIFLTAEYFIKRPPLDTKTFLTTSEINWFFTNAGPLQAYGEDENLYCKLIFVLIAVLGLSVAWLRISDFRKSGKLSVKNFFLKQDVFLLLFFTLVYLSYTQPNEDGHGGYITDRFVLFAFFFVILLIATHKINSKIGIPIITAILVLHSILLFKKEKVQNRLNQDMKDVISASHLIKPETVVLPIFNPGLSWQAKHFSNYIAAEKSVLVMENYEAETRYFPVIWQENNLPILKIDTLDNTHCLKWKSGKVSKVEYPADYIFIFDEEKNNKCLSIVTTLVNKHYDLAFSKNAVHLYQLRKRN